MRQHAPATETLLLICENQSETKQNKKPAAKKTTARRGQRGHSENDAKTPQAKKHPQTSSYKLQNLHALILTQTIAESGRPRVADLVVVLHNLRQLSRMTTEKEQKIQQQKNIPKLHLTRSSSFTL